eukprot:114331_1
MDYNQHTSENDDFNYGYSKNDIAFIGTIVALYMSILVILLLFIMLITKYVNKNELLCEQIASKQGRLMFIIYIFILIAFLSSNIYTSIVPSSDLFKNDLNNHDMQKYLQLITDIRLCYRIGRTFRLIFFIFRLNLCFKDSFVECTKKSLYTLSIFVAISIMLGILSYITATIPCTATQSVINKFKFYGQWFVVAAILIDIMITIVLLGLFVNKLRMVTINISETNIQASDIKDANMNKLREKSQLNTDQLSFMSTITKNTNLAIWCLLSSIIPETYWMIQSSIYYPDPLLFLLLLSLDGMLNCLCIYLIFAYTKYEYNILCKYCDLLVSKCCIKCTQKAITKKMMTYVLELQSAVQITEIKQQTTSSSPKPDNIIINADKIDVSYYKECRTHTSTGTPSTYINNMPDTPESQNISDQHHNNENITHSIDLDIIHDVQTDHDKHLTDLEDKYIKPTLDNSESYKITEKELNDILDNIE